MGHENKLPGSRQLGPYSPFDVDQEVGQLAEPGLWTTLGASLRSENLVGSYVADPTQDLSYSEYHKVTPGYNPFTNGDLEGYEDYAEEFLDAYNPIVVAAIKANIDRRLLDNEIRAASGWSLYTDLFASIADVSSLLPGGTLFRAGKLGYSVSKSAGAVGLASGAGTAVQEGGLHLTQPIRDGKESAFAIGGSIILGAVLGAGGAKVLSRSEFRKFSRALEQDLARDISNAGDVSREILRRMRAAGSGGVEDLKLDDLDVGGPRAARAISAAASRLNPGLDLLASKSAQARSTFLRLSENNAGSVAAREGRMLAGSVETAMQKFHRDSLPKVLMRFRENWSAARKGGWTGTFADFNRAVARAVRRGDINPDGTPHVEAAAKALRADLLDPLKQEAIEAGVLPQSFRKLDASGVLYRLWDRGKIMGDEERFRAILRRWLRDEMDKATARQVGREVSGEIRRAADPDLRSDQPGPVGERSSPVYDELNEQGDVRDKREKTGRAGADGIITQGESLHGSPGGGHADNGRPNGGIVAGSHRAGQATQGGSREKVKGLSPGGSSTRAREADAAPREDLGRLLDGDAPLEILERHPAIVEALERMAEIPPTHRAPDYLSDTWTAERRFFIGGKEVAGYEDGLDAFYQEARGLAWADDGLPVPQSPVKSERRATILLGPPAAGKSSFANPIARTMNAAIVDSDAIKKAMPEYADGLGANAVHEESSFLAN